MILLRNLINNITMYIFNVSHIIFFPFWSSIQLLRSLFLTPIQIFCCWRYESNGFYSTATALGNTGRCNNDTIRNSTATNFNLAAGQVLSNLLIAIPKIKGYYAATTEQVLGSNTTVYAVAQCAETVSKLECQNCMNVAFENIKSCPPRSGARAIDAGCFMRYADTPFFANNQTTNLKKYLKEGKATSSSSFHIFHFKSLVGL